jgi:hypothetical protein
MTRLPYCYLDLLLILSLCSSLLRALRGRRRVLKVNLVVDIVSGVGIGRHLGRVNRSTNPCRLREQEVWRECTVWASKSGQTEQGVKHAESPADALGSILFAAGEDEGCDGVNTLVDIAKNSARVEIGGAKLRNTGDDNVTRVHLSEAVGESLDGAVGCGAAVPVFGPPLGDILELAGALVVLSTNDAHDGFIVGNAASAVCAIGEELGVEGEGDDTDDLGERECVEVGVVVFGKTGTAGVMLAHHIHGELLLGVVLCKTDHLLDEAR